MGDFTDSYLSLQDQATAKIPGVADAVNTVKAIGSYLPPGRLRDAVTSGKVFMPLFMGGGLLSILKGKKYNWGQYWLGEKFMFHVLDRTDIKKRQSVPDDFVSPAQLYFTETLGVPIDVMDDLYKLMDGDHMGYLDRDPAKKLRETVPLFNAIRAAQIAKQFNEGMQHWDFESASAKIPPVTPYPGNAPQTPIPAIATNSFTNTPGTSISTPDSPQELAGVVVLPSWWYRNLWPLAFGGLLLVLVVARIIWYNRRGRRARR